MVVSSNVRDRSTTCPLGNTVEFGGGGEVEQAAARIAATTAARLSRISTRMSSSSFSTGGRNRGQRSTSRNAAYEHPHRVNQSKTLGKHHHTGHSDHQHE